MCGIAGWYKYGEAKVTEEELTELLINLQVRGRDATGIAWKNRKYHTLKASGPAEKFIELMEFKADVDKVLNSPFVFLHVRQATHGDPKQNKNNHPIMNKKGLIIHNGVIYPDKELDGAIGETDSEQLMLHIQEFGWKGIERVSGSMAIAYVDFAKPGFFLYAKGNPLVWAYDPDRQILFFCSTRDILYGSISTGFWLGQVPKVTADDVPPGMVYQVTKDGISEIEKVGPKAFAKVVYVNDDVGAKYSWIPGYH